MSEERRRSAMEILKKISEQTGETPLTRLLSELTREVYVMGAEVQGSVQPPSAKNRPQE